MGVSVRLSRNARVYLPFWIAIPAYLIVVMVWLAALIGWALVWLAVQGCKLAIAGGRRLASGRHSNSDA